jgi:beta-N-acetylhexosaminidase
LYKYLNFNGIIVTDDMAMTGKIDCGIGWGINLITGTFVEIDTMMKKIKPDVTQCAKVLKFLEDMKKRGE